MANTLRRRSADMVALADDVGLTCIRVGGRNGVRVHYRHIGVGRLERGLNARARAQLTRLAYRLCMLAPDVLDEVLEQPSRRLGHLVKASLRRAQKTGCKRSRFRRRPRSRVFRVFTGYP